MAVPTHSSNCCTKSFATKCPDCGQKVYYFTCSCGTKTFFEELGPPWPSHNCKVFYLRQEILSFHEEMSPKEKFAHIKKLCNDLVPSSVIEILNNEYGEKWKTLSYREIEFNESIKGFSGKIKEINNNINFYKRTGIEHSIIGEKLLGELSNGIYSEVIIVEHHDKCGICNMYTCFIKSEELKNNQHRINDKVVIEVRPSKSVKKFWIIKSLTRIE